MKSIKSILGASVAAFVLMAAAPQAMAQVAPASSVTTTWNAVGGNVNVTGSAAGSTAWNMGTAGNNIVGSLTLNNQANNPYGYGVSNTSSNLTASVGAGGEISSLVTRTNSGAMYGPGGQSINSYVFSNDGAAALVQNTNANYASMNDIGYGQPRTANNNTMEASGSQIQLIYGVDTGVAGNNAGFSLLGTGSASMRQNFTSASAGGAGLGLGGGITPVATFQANGTGEMRFGGITTNTMSVLGNNIVGTASNPGSFTGIVGYSGAQSWNNFGVVVTSGAPATPPAI